MMVRFVEVNKHSDCWLRVYYGGPGVVAIEIHDLGVDSSIYLTRHQLHVLADALHQLDLRAAMGAVATAPRTVAAADDVGGR